jgi:hypothetical protein
MIQLTHDDLFFIRQSRQNLETFLKNRRIKGWPEVFYSGDKIFMKTKKL